MKKKNAVVAQSGGPTCAINATLSGVVFKAQESGEIGTVYGALNGIEGLRKETIVDLGSMLMTAGEYRLLETTPAAALGICRYRLPKVEDDPAVYKEIFEIFEKFNIGYFFYIGGNDSMDTANKVNEYAKAHGYDVKAMGVPKTIDNDLVETDHTPGYGSAAKYIATSMLELTRDCSAYPIPSVTIVEIMGRDAGWLTAAAVLARMGCSAPHLIYLPEVPFDQDKFFDDVERQLSARQVNVVAVSEGIRDKDGTYIAQYASNLATDSFGHKALTGVGKYLEGVVKSKFGCKTRSVEFSILQRCAAHFSSATDISESVAIGKATVEAALNGDSGKMLIYVRHNEGGYSVSFEPRPLMEIANKEKKVPLEWITNNGTDLSQEMVDYVKPLIQGEVPIFVDSGIPKHFYIDRSSIVTAGA